MTRRLAPAALLFVLAACQAPAAPDPNAGTVAVADVVCRPTPPGRRSTACYLTLTASKTDTLTAVSTPAAPRVELHESRMENNMMVMTPLPAGVPLPAGEAVTLAPSGKHLMLLGIADPLTAGETVELMFTFASAPAVTVPALVGQPTPGDTGAHAGH